MSQVIEVDFYGDMEDSEMNEVTYLEDYESPDGDNILECTGNVDVYDSDLDYELTNGDTISFSTHQSGSPYDTAENKLIIAANGKRADLSEHVNDYLEELGSSYNYCVEIPLAMYEDYLQGKIK